MEPGEFKQANFTFTAPKGMEESCGSLSVFKGVDPEGLPCIISKWIVTDEDLERIKRQRYIWLNITGNGMPPVAVFTEWPFEEVAVVAPPAEQTSQNPSVEIELADPAVLENKFPDHGEPKKDPE